MTRVVRYAVKAIINAGPYESLHFELDESINVDEAGAATARERLIRTVNARIEREVLRAREDIARAQARTRRGGPGDDDRDRARRSGRRE